MTHGQSRALGARVNKGVIKMINGINGGGIKLTDKEKAQALDRHAGEYESAFKGDQADFWLLQRATQLRKQAEQIRRKGDQK